MQSQAATFALRATSVLDASIPVAQIPAAGAILELRDVLIQNGLVNGFLI